jgi:hypothetical protein
LSIEPAGALYQAVGNVFLTSLRAQRSNLAVHNALKNPGCHVAKNARRNDTTVFFNSRLKGKQSKHV